MSKLDRSRLEMKALGVDDDARTFEGLASAWSLDLQADRIVPGAFKRWIREWRKSDRVLPLLDSHNPWTIFTTVGKLLDAEERDDGLWTRWRIIPGPKGDEVLSLLSSEDGGPFVDSMSIGYRATRWEIEHDDELDVDVRVIKEIQLEEVSLVRFPAQPDATIDADSVRKSLEELVEATPTAQRAELKSALSAVADKCIGGACSKSTAPLEEDDSAPPDPAGGDDDGEPPDPGLLDSIKLRRLRLRRSATIPEEVVT